MTETEGKRQTTSQTVTETETEGKRQITSLTDSVKDGDRRAGADNKPDRQGNEGEGQHSWTRRVTVLPPPVLPPVTQTALLRQWQQTVGGGHGGQVTTGHLLALHPSAWVP